jgi:transcriptional regulator with XRE-family HTH domain
LLRAKRISQKKLALTIRMDQSQLSGLVKGSRPPPSNATLELICSALQATSAELSELLIAAKHDRCIRNLDALVDDEERALVSQLLCMAPALSAQQRMGLSRYLEQLHLAAVQMASLTARTTEGSPT